LDAPGLDPGYDVDVAKRSGSDRVGRPVLTKEALDNTVGRTTTPAEYAIIRDAHFTLQARY